MNKIAIATTQEEWLSTLARSRRARAAVLLIRSSTLHPVSRPVTFVAASLAQERCVRWGPGGAFGLDGAAGLSEY